MVSSRIFFWLSFRVICALFSVAIAIFYIYKKKNWLDPSRPKLPPGALFAIPDDLLADIYTSWLLLEDVGRLDSALCNKTWRPQFVRLISTKFIRFCREEINVLDGYKLSTARALNLQALEWILKRGIHLASLRLHPRPPACSYEIEFVHNSIKQFLDSGGGIDNLEAFDLFEYYYDLVEHLLDEGRLDNLEAINFCDCYYIRDAELTAILAKNVTTMKSIDIQGCRVMKRSAVVIKHCTMLEALAVTGNESAADIVEIVQSCRKIRKLNLSRLRDTLSDEVLQSVVSHCRLLEHLDIGGCHSVSDAVIRTVVESCPLLKYINRYDGTYDSINIFHLDTCIDLETLLKRPVVTTRFPHIGFSICTLVKDCRSVEALIVKFQELRYIDDDGILHISDATFMKLLTGSPCARLVHFNH